MTILRNILDRIVLVAAVIAAGCIPSFIVQYRQRIGGMLDQIMKDIAPFQTIADKFHHGSLKELIQHHMSSSDSTFYSEGAAVRSMVESLEQLQLAAQSLNTDVYHQISYLVFRMDRDVAAATWDVFSPSFDLTVENLIFVSIVGVCIWLVFLSLWSAFSRLYAIMLAR